MPGKVNPVVPEAVRQVCAQVIGNDAAVGVRRRAGRLRAERDAPGDGPQPAGVDPAAGRGEPAARRPLRRRPGGRRGGLPARTPRARRRSSPRSTATSGTTRRPRSPSRRWRSGKSIREVVIERGHVAAGQAHRGAARRGARRAADDPPVTPSAPRPPSRHRIRTCRRPAPVTTRSSSTASPTGRSSTTRRCPRRATRHWLPWLAKQLIVRGHRGGDPGDAARLRPDYPLWSAASSRASRWGRGRCSSGTAAAPAS